jgi:hypothetical protein
MSCENEENRQELTKLASAISPGAHHNAMSIVHVHSNEPSLRVWAFDAMRQRDKSLALGVEIPPWGLGAVSLFESLPNRAEFVSAEVVRSGPYRE